MIGFLRNPEVRNALLYAVVVTVVGSLAGMLVSPISALIVLLTGLLLGVPFFLWTRRRYRQMASLASVIDAILHGADEMDLSAYSEGEFGVLRDELYKMTVRLREQADCLRADRARLADAMTDISHQLRTPLTAIRLNLSLLRDGTATASQRQTLLQETLSLLDRFDWLLDAMLKLSRIDAGVVSFQREMTGALALVNRAAQPLQIPMELHGQSILIDIPADLMLFCDPPWTAEALGNILKNCMEHMQAGGTLLVRATGNALYAEVIVEDDGSGIDPDDLPHLFERFYRGKDAPIQSAGVGLALTRTILAAQDGSVRAENRPAGGARFTIRLYYPLS